MLPTPNGNGGDCPPQMKLSIPPKNVLSIFEEHDKLSSETNGVSQRWSLYLLWWLCIYSAGKNEIWTLKLNLILKVKVNHPHPQPIGILNKVFCIFCKKKIGGSSRQLQYWKVKLALGKMVDLEMCRIYLTKQIPGNSRNSTEQRMSKSWSVLGNPIKEFINKLWGQSNQWFVC